MKKVILSIFSFLIAIAPVLATTPQSFALWGDVEIPESLKH